MKMKSKRYDIFLCICMIGLMISGCGRKDAINNKNSKNENLEKQEIQEQNKEESNSMKKKEITKDELMKEYNITEEDMEGIDVYSFLNMSDIELGVTDELYVQEELQYYKEEFSEQAPMSYAYLINQPIEGEFTQDKVTDIVRIIWQENDVEEPDAFVVDFKGNRIYEGARIDKFNKDNLVSGIDGVISNEIIQLIAEYDLYNWKGVYEGKSTEGTTTCYDWYLVFEFEDGAIYKFSGEGLGDSAYPEKLHEFVSQLKKCVLQGEQ